MTHYSRLLLNCLLLPVMLLMLCSPLMAQSITDEQLSQIMQNALELQKANRHAEALDVLLKVGKHTEKQRTESERLMYVGSQLQACECYKKLKRYAEGYSLAQKLMAGRLAEAERTKATFLYVINGYNLASKMILQKERNNIRYSESRKILLDIAPYADSTLAKHVLPKIPMTWYFQGMDYYVAQNFQQSKACFLKALQGFLRVGRTKDIFLVRKALASAHENLFEFTEAQQQYCEALALIREKGMVTEQISLLNMQWTLANEVGHADLAQQTALAIDSLIETTDDARSKYYYYLQKTKDALRKSQYRLAEEWCLKAKELAEAVKSQPSPMNRNVVYIMLRDMYLNTRRFDEALHYAQLIIDNNREAGLKYKDIHWTDYTVLANIYKEQGDKARCFACFDSISQHIDQIDDPKLLAHIYMFRGMAHAAFSNYEAALADYRKADAVLAVHYQPTDEKRLRLLSLQGGAAHQCKLPHEAERLYTLFADYSKQLYGEQSINYVEALIKKAHAEAFAENVEAGCRNYTEAAKCLKIIMKERLPYLNTEEKEVFWNPISSLLLNMTPYALKAGLHQTDFTEKCYDALVLSKAFLLDSERTLYDVVKREGTEADMSDYMQLALMKNQLNKWENKDRPDADSILSLARRADRMAARLAARCRSYGCLTDFMDVDYRVVKRALKPNEVLIDFTDFVTESQGRRYAAYVVRPDDAHPLLTDLFAEQSMDSLHITRPDLYYDSDFAPDVLQLLWKPLQKHIAPGSTVYYVPTQLLYRVALESLPLPDGSLLGEHYHFVRLSSARELLRKSEPHLMSRPQSAVLYGGLHYDLQPNVMLAEAQKYDLSKLMVMRGDALRGDSVYSPLPGSRIEVQKIDSILTARHWQVTSRTGTDGTEESFLSMHEHSPQVLQIATHGFYYTPDRAREVDYLKGYSDAMLLSGIVLSGANAAWQGKQLPKGVLSGILTARNISRLDLSKTEMVVLSSCQSGQGKATPEGLYGLQRAFKKAGVGTMVMALWNVSDKVATEFMVTFYEQLASPTCAWHKRKAFERAKAIIRSKYPDPFYWAAFVILD